MAIKKKIITDNGITTEYHRIALLSIDVNNQNTILVHSYLSESARQIEKDYAAGLYNNIDVHLVKFPYVDAQYLHLKYNGEMNIQSAYEYLKTLTAFSNAEDV